MKLEIESILVLSTAHINKQTSEALDLEDSDLHEMLTIYPHGERGWLVYTERKGGGLMGEIPDDLAQCLNLAYRLECEWFLLDRDGPRESFLDEYDW